MWCSRSLCDSRAASGVALWGYGGYSGRETPGDIPNPVVKLASADGTASLGVWESRSPPDIFCDWLGVGVVPGCGVQPPHPFFVPFSADAAGGLVRARGRRRKPVRCASAAVFRAAEPAAAAGRPAVTSLRAAAALRARRPSDTPPYGSRDLLWIGPPARPQENVVWKLFGMRPEGVLKDDLVARFDGAVSPSALHNIGAKNN